VQKKDILWLLLVLTAVVIFSIFGLPYFTQSGHPLWAILVYAFFAVLFLYGRCNRLPKETTRRHELR